MSQADSNLKNVIDQVEKYTNQNGLFKVNVKNDAEMYLNMPKATIHKLTGEESAEAGVILMQYASFVQNAYNTEISKVHWCDSEISRVISGEIKQYSAASLEERKSLAIDGNEYARRLYVLRNWAQATADKLSFMSNRIENIATSYMSLAKSRSKYNGRDN